METETLDRLFLELSQFTRAKTKRECELEEQVAEFAAALEWAQKGPAFLEEHVVEAEYLYRGGDDPICGVCTNRLAQGHEPNCDVHAWQKWLASKPKALAPVREEMP